MLRHGVSARRPREGSVARGIAVRSITVHMTQSAWGGERSRPIAGLTAPLVGIGALLGGMFLWVFVAIAVATNVIGYWFSDRLALKARRGQPGGPRRHPGVESQSVGTDRGDEMPPLISRGFRGRRGDAPAGRVPPGQYVTRDFPVLSAGPTPHTPLEQWDFSIVGEVDEPRRWSREEFRALPSEEVTVDVHCVTKWSKLDTVWQGVSVDILLDGVETAAEYVVQFCDGGYTTNLPLEDVTGGKAWVAFAHGGEPLEAEHGGPARMLVPHLYFWKSAKWVRGLQLQTYDEPGFWEINGYHNYGDPWQEQRYWGD